MALPPLHVRSLTADDADAMVDLATLCEIAETGEPDAEVVDWIRAGSGDSTFVAYGVHDEAGLAAFGYVDCAGGHTGLTAEVRVRPGLELEIGTPLLDQLRAAAKAYDATKPLHVFVNAGAVAQQRWWERQSAVEVRRFWRMTIDLGDERPEVPAPPPGVNVRTVVDDEHELRMVHAVVESAFAEHFGHADDRTYDEWIDLWRRREGFDLGLWWIAEVESQPVAVVLGQTIGDAGHISTVGTLSHARGRGLATLLLRTSFAQLHDRGLRQISLGVDSSNPTGAVRLYESVGMHVSAEWALYELAPAPD